MKNVARTKTDVKMIGTAERRAYVLALRRSGWTYAKIAQAAVGKFGAERLPLGWDERYACKDVKRELDKLNEDNTETVEGIRRIVTMRMDRMIAALWQKVLRGNVAAIDRVTRIDERRCKLWGVDAAQTLEHTGKDGGPVPITVIEVVKDYGDGTDI